MSDQKNEQNNGFTLIEIIVVIIIVGVLVSLAIPRMTGTIERFRASEGAQILTAMLRAQRAYHIENGNYSGFLVDLDVEFSGIDNFVAPIANDPGAAGIVATIDRSTGTYRLRITNEGDIDCVNLVIDACIPTGY